MAATGAGAKRDAADGRIQRGVRNREAIVAALYALIGEGALQPTAEQVATRAGVQVRTVFRHFDDMESLNAELGSRLRRQVAPLLEAPRPHGSPADRARALVRLRSALFEEIAPYKRAANTQRWRYPGLEEEHRSMVRELRAHLAAVFPELRGAPAAIAAALELALSFEAWDRLRCEQRLGPDRARAAMEQAALALVAHL